MRDFGYRVEYALAAETSPADQPRHDEVKMSSFPDEGGPGGVRRRPAHGEIAQKLYPDATDNVGWLTGRAIG